MIKKPSPFVIDAVQEFLGTKAAREPKTTSSYSGYLLGSERGTKPALGIPLASYFFNRRFNSVSEEEVATWFAQRVDGGAQATKHRISKGSRQFLRFAEERGYTDRSLAAAIEPFAAGSSRIDWLEWDEIHALLKAIPEDRYQFAAAWLFYTGCRVQEACDAIQADVKFRTEMNFYEWQVGESKTHVARSVWLPDTLRSMLEETRVMNSPAPGWPVLWDCEGRGFGRVEHPAHPIAPRMINAVLERGRESVGLTTPVTAHVARHSYCTNWIRSYGSDELAMEKLSRQVGTSVGVLRDTYIHITLTASDWEHLRALGA
jgi:integrase